MGGIISMLLLCIILIILLKAQKDNNPLLYTVSILSFTILIIFLIIKAYPDNKYKVKELERNSVFYITSEDKYQVGDTIWVNIEKLKPDPIDSVAMLSVIIKDE